MVSSLEAFEAAFAACPLIAILRGVQPDEVVAIGQELVAAGFSLIEVPMNSPAPLDSVRRLASAIGDRALIGAGTVLTVDQVSQVQEAGGQMIISPNTNVKVIRTSAALGLVSLPGFATPSEGLAALDAGATALKLFPAEAASPIVLKAMRAIMPATVRVLPVGGIVPDGMTAWTEAGAAGFGLGSALYRPGMAVAEIGERARTFVAAIKRGA